MKVMVLNPPSKHSENVVRDLFYGCWCKGKRIASAEFPPSTLLYIYTVLIDEGHDTSLVDTQAIDMPFDTLKKKVEREHPDAIIIPTATMSFNEDAKNLLELKKKTNTKTIVFGSHVTFFPRESLKHEGIDFTVTREPEYIIRDLIKCIETGRDYKTVKGIGYRRNSKIVINEPYPFIDNLDDLPIPDRGPVLDFAYFNPLVKKLPWMTAITSRGCPGRCIFCTSPSFYGKTWRSRSPRSVVDEMIYLKEKGYNEIFYRDETFTTNKQRVYDLCELIAKENIDMSWLCSARVGTVDKQMMEVMKKAGCHMIRIGVESGVQKILININKGITVDGTRKTFKWAREVGMETHAHMMLGCVGETKESVKKTIKFIKEIEPTTVTFGAMTPFPGTKLFKMVKENVPEIGDGSARDLSTVHSAGFFSNVFCELSDEEVGQAVRRAYREFYIRPSYIANTLRRIKSFDEFRRVVSAGLQVLSYSVGSE